jgi:hypothetical protein
LSDHRIDMSLRRIEQRYVARCATQQERQFGPSEKHSLKIIALRHCIDDLNNPLPRSGCEAAIEKIGDV